MHVDEEGVKQMIEWDEKESGYSCVCFQDRYLWLQAIQCKSREPIPRVINAYSFPAKGLQEF